MAKKYTYDEAVEAVLNLRAKTGNMPVEADFLREFSGEELKALAKALDQGNDFGKKIPVSGQYLYACINIAVLRELRRRNNEEVYIAKSAGPSSVWKNDNYIPPETITNEELD